MAIVKQSTAKPVVGEMRKIGGVIKEWTGKQWVAYVEVRKQPYVRKQVSQHTS